MDYLNPCSTVAADITQNAANYTFVRNDIKDTNLMYCLLQKYDIDTIIHFAAQSHVDTSFTSPMMYTEDNTLGTHSLLEASRRHGKIQRFIHFDPFKARAAFAAISDISSAFTGSYTAFLVAYEIGAEGELTEVEELGRK